MKKRIALILAIGLAMLLAESHAAMLTNGNYLDSMTAWTTTSLWYAYDTTNTDAPNFGYHYLSPQDPREMYDINLRNSTMGPDAPAWFSYKTVSTAGFSYVDVSYVAGWSGAAGAPSLAYSLNGGGTWINLTPTGTNLYGEDIQGGTWNCVVNHYDLASQSLSPGEIKVSMSGVGWSPYMSSVYLEVVPEPASLALLGLGGLFCLRRSRR